MAFGGDGARPAVACETIIRDSPPRFPAQEKAAAPRMERPPVISPEGGWGDVLEGERLHALGRNRVAAGDRLGDFAGELDHGLAHLRALGDEVVEGGADIVALELEEAGRRLDFGDAIDRTSGVWGNSLSGRLGLGGRR